MKKKMTVNQKINIVVRGLFVLAFLETVMTSVFENDYTSIINAFTAVLGFALTFVPDAVENITKNRIRFSSGVKIAIVLFIFGSELLGEIRSFYEIFPWWDNLLHSVSGVILGLIGFMIVYGLNESENTSVNLSPLLVSAFAFFFALACGALWEIFEFSGDRLLGLNMQKFRPPVGTTELVTASWRYDAGLIDTMTDIILDAVSAFGISLLGYIKIKAGKWHRGKAAEEECIDKKTI